MSPIPKVNMWCSLHYICLQETTEQVVQSGHKEFEGWISDGHHRSCLCESYDQNRWRAGFCYGPTEKRKYIWSTALVSLIRDIHNPKAFSLSPAMGSLLPLNPHGFSFCLNFPGRLYNLGRLGPCLNYWDVLDSQNMVADCFFPTQVSTVLIQFSVIM